MTDPKERAAAAAARYERKFGHKGASIGRYESRMGVVPTGILALDYALGTGGWPLGHIVEVFGPPDIGKSSLVGFSAIKEAQAKGLVAGWVALEPGYDSAWAEKNGVDVDSLVVGWPNNGQEAFDFAYDFVNDPDIDIVIFDSIGAILRESEADENGKPAQGGQSGLITWGVKRLLMPTWKQEKLVILINQIRDNMNNRTNLPLFDSPGGHALKHSAMMRVQLKPGKERYMVKKDGNDVMAGREVIAHILRNKMSEGTGNKAVFDYYFMETDTYPFGVDRTTDVLNVGLRTGVIRRGGAWYYHDAFPDGKLNGANAIKEYMGEHPETYDSLREQVLERLNGKE